MNPAELYEAITVAIQNETGASDSLLHVHAGLAILLVTRVATGQSLATPIPFLAVCAFAAINEILDRVTHGAWLWPDTALDLVNTLFWPLVLMIGLRARRSRQAAASQRSSTGELRASADGPRS